MIDLAKGIVLLFGIFLLLVGFLMLFAPDKARNTLQKAGSTNLINYAEITLRMIPAAGLVWYADFSKFPDLFKLVGWFMLLTSFVLYFVPRKIHHNYAVKSADVLKPIYVRLLSPFSFLFGAFLIYAVV